MLSLKFYLIICLSDEGENQTPWFELYGVASMVKLYIGKSFQNFIAFPVIMFWKLNVNYSLFFFIKKNYSEGCNLVFEFSNHIYDEYFCYMLCILSKFRGDIVKFTSWELWNLCKHVLFFFFGFASYPWLWHVLFLF